MPLPREKRPIPYAAECLQSSQKANASQAVDAWYSEVHACVKLPGCEEGKSGAQVGHFTALVWKGAPDDRLSKLPKLSNMSKMKVLPRWAAAFQIMARLSFAGSTLISASVVIVQNSVCVVAISKYASSP